MIPIVAFSGKWLNSDIIDHLFDDKKPFIFTMIDRTKFKEIEEECEERILKYNFSKYVRILSKKDNKERSDLLKIQFDKIKTLYGFHVYDNHLEILFPRNIINEIIKMIDYKRQFDSWQHNHRIAIYSAGMSESDIVTTGYIYMKLMGYTVDPRIDIGVDNIRKTRGVINDINKCDIIICTAGMEAILPTVIANISHKPVIAVPSDVGYGMGGNGMAGINSILRSNAPGIAIFNIGNIYGACTFARHISKLHNRNKTLDPTFGKETVCKEKYLTRYDCKGIAFIDNDEKIHDILLTDNENDNKNENMFRIAHLSNAIRNMFPLINTNNKDYLDIIKFITTHDRCVVRNNSGIDLGSIQKDIKHIDQVTDTIQIHIEKGNTNLFCKDLIKTSHTDHPGEVLIIGGGFSDKELIEELKVYLRKSNIICASIDYLHINHVILDESSIKKSKIEFDNYDIIVVVAGGNGTLSNAIGSISGSIPIIALPNSNDKHTLVSMLQNCVGGIAVVENRNAYSAACLVGSILFDKSL